MKKNLLTNSLIIGVFLMLAFSAEKIINGGKVGARELIASVIGAVIGGVLSVFLLSKYSEEDLD